jgi:hypothetical protein
MLGGLIHSGDNYICCTSSCRFHRDMHTDKFNVSMWRKSSQWVVLNR